MNMATPSLRIFLVENHEDTITYMRMYLEQLGHKVEVARDVETALAKIPAFDMDLLISDIGLPDGSGWQLLSQIAPQRQVFAVAMSGLGRSDDKARSLAAGFRHHLVKPFLPEELDAILAEASREICPAP
jgi:DNA-binding response OmpR family regulator